MLSASDFDGSQGPNGGHGCSPYGRRVGQILIETAGLQPEHLEKALERQAALAAKHRYYLLGRVLVGMGLVNAADVNKAVSIQQTTPTAADNTLDAYALVNSQRNEVWQVNTENGPLRPLSALRSLSAMNERVAAGDLDSMTPIALGFDPLDEALGGGLRAGELLLLGGPQGVGKTTMAFQMARNIAASEEANCLYVCFEHDEDNLTQRLLAMESFDRHNPRLRCGVTVHDLARQITTGRREAERGLYDSLLADPRSNAALQRLAKYGDRLYLLKGSGTHTTLTALTALIESHCVRSDERLVLFVDYLQKVPVTPEASNDQERVARVVTGLKELALSLQVPVVAVVAADSEGLKSRRPKAHHLWGGSALAYEADIILMLSEKYDSVARVHIEFNPHKAQAFRDWLVCTVEKQRSGRGRLDMEFEKQFNYCCLNPNGNFVSEKLIDDRMYTE